MKQVLAAVMLGSVAFLQLPVVNAQSQMPGSYSPLKSANPHVEVPSLPPAPGGKSTILGGEIMSVDPVRDELTLKVFGQRPIKILFDERTQVFRDGNRISLLDLGRSGHASVQTLLDGTAVFALSVHMLSQSAKGEYQGRILNYNPETRELTIDSAMIRAPFKLMVPAGTPIIRVGQPSFAGAQPGSSDLVKGTLISVKFQPDNKGLGIASQISVLATPGSAFQFTGDISVLDLHSGILVLVDSQDQKTYQVSFDSARLQAIKNIHQGDHVTVTAEFDGARYVASAIQSY